MEKTLSPSPLPAAEEANLPEENNPVELTDQSGDQSSVSGSQRLLSLDTLRGFNMLFIMGGAGFFIALAKLWPNGVTNAIAGQMSHVSWNGFAHHDMIFPLFLFLAGVAFPFSFARQQEKGKTRWQIYRKIFIRAFLLVLFGVLYGNAVKFDFANLRYASVLGHIGLAWMFAALIFMNTRWYGQLIIAIVLLVGYWLLVALVPAPDVNSTECFTRSAFTERASHLLEPDEQIQKNYTMEGSIVGYVDRTCLPGKLYKKVHDPEGLLSVLPAIVTALLGVMTGSFVRKNPQTFSPHLKSLLMIIAGVVLIVIGFYWNKVFPINKNLWTSSFVCFVGGISLVAFAAFYYVIDVLKFRCWTTFFAVIGMNSITIYLAQRIIGAGQAKDFFFKEAINLCPAAYHPILESAA